MIIKYGNGPFKVEKINLVPKDSLKLAGHNQWIVMSKTINDEKCLYCNEQWRLERDTKEYRDTTFSGIYFKKHVDSP